MLTKESAIETISKFIEACNEKNILFQKVIFFGSALYGKTNEFSDIDVALVSEQFSGNPFSDWHLLSPINIYFSEIEPHPFSPKYFEEGDPFIDEIKKTGMELPI